MGDSVTDLEIARLCAEAMGFPFEDGYIYRHSATGFTGIPIRTGGARYDPLRDDAQAMALVKEKRLFIGGNSDQWMVQPQANTTIVAWGADLNRAICECVAKLQATK